MRTITKKLVITSVLLSTALLAAVSVYAAPLYFPHVATTNGWQTEIAIINTSNQTVTGIFRALDNKGLEVEAKAVSLPALGRRQITVAEEFTNHINIGYIFYETDSNTVQGYTKFYIAGVYGVAIPAVKEVNTGDIYISHIASNSEWWTGISLVNTSAIAKTLTITFSDGQLKQITLAASEHRAFSIRDLFNSQPQSDIKSAVITNASGIIGLELFGTLDDKQLEGILLTDKTTSTIYYPHVASNSEWWTGIVAYNPSELACSITITPYSAQGTPLSPSTLPIPGKGKYIGSVAQLDLPDQTAWFKIEATSLITGFELFGTVDGNQLGAYAEKSGAGAKEGVFAKIEKNGWTGIAFVNTEDSPATVTLTAYTDDGAAVATKALSVGNHAKVVNQAELIFFPTDISSATYIAFTSDKNVVGFQLNGSLDWAMLDGLPALAGGGNGGNIGEIVSEGTKNAAVDGVHAFLNTIKALDPAAKAQRVADYMTAQGDFQYVNISNEGTVYAEFKDGDPYFVIMNRKLGPEDRANLDFPASYYEEAVAGVLVAAAVRIPEKKPVVLAAGLNYYDPKLFDPNTISTQATSHILDIAEMLCDHAKYQLSSAVDCTYRGLKRVRDVKPAVMYLNVHSGWGTDRAGEDVYTIPTLTPWPDPITPDVEDDRINDRVYRVSAEFIDKDGDIVVSQVIGISRQFVREYWSFAKDALIYVDGCFSGDTASTGFRSTAINKGAGCYIGWRGIANADNCYPTARVYFDRMTGFNNYQKVTPSQRAFPAKEVLAELLKEGLPVSRMTVSPDNPTGGLLEPSIERIIVTERKYEEDDGTPRDKSTMTIKGMFGSADGHDIKVTVNDQEMKNLQINIDSDGNIDNLQCDLPMDPSDPGFAGNVVVSVDKHKSNAVPLTLWHWKLHQTYVYNAGNEVIFNQNVRWDLYIRADVHPNRTEPGGTLQQPESVYFTAAPGSKVTFTFSTMGKLSSSPPSGTLPYCLRADGTAVKGYLFEGTIKMQEGKLMINNFFGHPIYITGSGKPMGLFPDPAYISWPGVSSDKSYAITSDYVIQDGSIPGIMPVDLTELQFDVSTPLYKPGTSIDTAGEDVNFQ